MSSTLLRQKKNTTKTKKKNSYDATSSNESDAYSSEGGTDFDESESESGVSVMEDEFTVDEPGAIKSSKSRNIDNQGNCVSVAGSSTANVCFIRDDLKKKLFVIVKYQYSIHNKEECLRYYIGMVKELHVGEEKATIVYLRKYLNRHNEFVFVKALDDGKERASG